MTLPCHAGIDGEFCWFVHNDACWLQAWTKGFHLQQIYCCSEYDRNSSMHTVCYSGIKNYLLRENVIDRRKDMSHEGAVLDVLVVTNHMDSIVTRLSWPVAHITGAIALIITLNFSL